MSLVALLRDASHAGTMMMALKKIGPKNVAIRNHFDRTRSRYSRLMTAQSLAMSGHSLFDARGADLFKKNLMKRRLDHLESLHRCARLDNPSKQYLRICAVRHFYLEEAIGVVRALHQRLVAQNLPDLPHIFAFESKRNVLLPVFLFDARDLAVKHLFAARDNANGIAQSLRIVHEVSAENHRLAALLQ